MNMRHFTLTGLLYFSVAQSSNPVKELRSPHIDFERVFQLKLKPGQSMDLNNALQREACKLNRIWTHIHHQRPRNVLKKELDEIFNAMHAQVKKISPFQGNELYSLEVEVRLLMYGIHGLIAEGVDPNFIYQHCS